MQGDGEHGKSTGATLEPTLIPGPFGGSLLRVPKGGRSPNPNGRPAKKRITDALLARLDEEPGLEKKVIQWWLDMIENGDSAALREFLARIEGRIASAEQRELPSIVVAVQNVTNPPHQPVPLSRPTQPSLQDLGNRSNGVIEVQVERIDPPSDPDEDEESDE